jgi:muramoyltetrapeptide carboxypeptidase
MVTIPPYLKPGDTIGIVCPAGFMPFEKALTCIEALKVWGFNVVPGKTLGNQYHYFSGTDEQRRDDLQQMLDDENIDAILCARGGYGTVRIIDKLDFSKFIQHPKWVIGFSDITVLHCHLFSNYKIASMHGPMAAAFDEYGLENKYIQSLHEALLGKKADYKTEGSVLDQSGKAKGILVGGNLSLLVNLIGTPSDIQTKNKILFIEEIGEYIYSVDRMMYQLKRSGKVDHLKGLIIGGFSDMKDTTLPFGQSVQQAVKDLVKDYRYPVCFDFPISHEKQNFAVKVGLKYKLNVSKNLVELQEL